jgi:hypothetical protein
MAMTGSPGCHAGSSLVATVPARSIPGTIGQLLTIAPLPVTASASL